MRHELDRQTGPAFRRLNDAVVQLLDDFSMVTFTPLDISEEESIEDLLMQIDMAIQVGGGRAWEHAGTGGRGGVGWHSACFAAYSSPARCSLALPCPALLPSCLFLQYGEDQEVKTQEMGDMDDPDNDDGE